MHVAPLNIILIIGLVNIRLFGIRSDPLQFLYEKNRQPIIIVTSFYV